MNINQYRRSMDEITVNQIDVNALFNKNSKRITHIKHIKQISVFAMACLLIIIFISIRLFYHSSVITVEAYASETDVQLTKELATFHLDAKTVDGVTTDDYSYINYNLYFKCEGTDINTITYTCTDQPVNRNNRSKAPAYYVENTSIPGNEYSEQINDENFLYGYKAEGENIAKITKLIGNSYTVNYEEQNNKQYGIIIAASVDKNGHYQIKDTIIKIDITLHNGSIQHKKLLIHPTEDSFSHIQICIL